MSNKHHLAKDAVIGVGKINLLAAAAQGLGKATVRVELAAVDKSGKVGLSLSPPPLPLPPRHLSFPVEDARGVETL